ncbi:hypothetical protein [Pararhodobacter sp.]|uniref:hypothetical protein n=1 Tax=Pararhodobacter sp. TaxID=2127056 RepID=UPI002FDDF41A
MGALMDWWSLVPTLLGASISLITTLVVLGLSQKWERERRKEEEKKLDCVKAIEGLHELLHIANYIHNIEHRMSVELRGKENTEPSDVIGTIILPHINTNAYSAEKWRFLATAKKPKLISDIWEVEMTYLNCLSHISDYNCKRMDYEKFLHVEGVTFEIEEGMTIINVNDNKKAIADAKLASANIALWKIIKYADEERSKAQGVFDEAFEAAKSHFGDLIPMGGVDWSGRPQEIKQ